jgi:hypothetical protein
MAKQFAINSQAFGLGRMKYYTFTQLSNKASD